MKTKYGYIESDQLSRLARIIMTDFGKIRFFIPNMFLYVQLTLLHFGLSTLEEVEGI